MVTETPAGECANWTLKSGDVVVEITASLDESGAVTFDCDLVSGVADLNGI